MSVTPTLTPREHAFVAAYLETHNATQAYIKAGYSPKGANANAARLIAKDSVSAAIQVVSRSWWKFEGGVISG